MTRPAPESRATKFPVGNAVTVEELQTAPYDLLRRLRQNEPVSWVPALNAWLVTERTLAIEAMRDATTYTVQDSRFTTGAIIGSSMLSLDGPEHTRQRRPYAFQFRPEIVREQFDAELSSISRALIDRFASDGEAELRTALAGPLAVIAIVRFLGLGDVDPDRILARYRVISEAIVEAATADPLTTEDSHDGYQAALRDLRQVIATAIRSGSSKTLEAIRAEGSLSADEIVTTTLVVMFGAIETSEGMTANALWHLLTHPGVLERVGKDRSLVPAVVTESLRLEPAAAVVDRYATKTARLGDATIPKREMVTISLLGANRDPATFENPDLFNIDRENANQHVTFVQGPHSCIGLHLARRETEHAINALLDALPGIVEAGSSHPEGLIFRKPARVSAQWSPLNSH